MSQIGKDPGRKRAEVKELGVNVGKDPGRKELTGPWSQRRIRPFCSWRNPCIRGLFLRCIDRNFGSDRVQRHK